VLDTLRLRYGCSPKMAISNLLLKLQSEMDQAETDLNKYADDIKRIGEDGISQPGDVFIIRLMCKMFSNKRRLLEFIDGETETT
jgi:hypothetical protein